MLKNTMIIIINTTTGEIRINNNQIIEKEDDLNLRPELNNLPIKYNPIDIKRKYYKKWEQGYNRNPIWQSKERQSINLISNFSKFDKTVKQEPLLDFHL